MPEISQNEDRNENLSPRGGKYNLRPNPNLNYSEDFRYYEESNDTQKRALFSSFYLFTIFFFSPMAVFFE